MVPHRSVLRVSMLVHQSKPPPPPSSSPATSGICYFSRGSFFLSEFSSQSDSNPNPTMPTAHYVPRRGSKNCPPCLPPPWGEGIFLTNDDNDDAAAADDDGHDDATRGGTKKLRTTIVAGSGGDAP